MRARVFLLLFLVIGSTAGQAASLPAYVAAIDAFAAEVRRLAVPS